MSPSEWLNAIKPPEIQIDFAGIDHRWAGIPLLIRRQRKAVELLFKPLVSAIEIFIA